MAVKNTFKKYDKSGAYHHQLMTSDPFYIAKIHKALSFVTAGGLVCDVGCGDGVFLKYAKAAGADMVGIDTSEEGIKLAKEFSGCENLHIGFAHELPLENDSTDLIVMIDVINYLEDYSGAIKEAARKLKSGGKLIIMSPIDVDLKEERNSIDDSWQSHVCNSKELETIIAKDMAVSEVSFIKKPVLKFGLSFAINILIRSGIINLLRTLLIRPKSETQTNKDTPITTKTDIQQDIYLKHSFAPDCLIKNHESIEFVIVGTKE